MLGCSLLQHKVANPLLIMDLPYRVDEGIQKIIYTKSLAQCPQACCLLFFLVVLLFLFCCYFPFYALHQVTAVESDPLSVWNGVTSIYAGNCHLLHCQESQAR